MKNSLENKIIQEYEKGIEIPSSNLWGNLEAKLDASEQKVIPTKSTKMNWLKYAAVILGLITLGILFKFAFHENSSIENVPTITKIETPGEIPVQNDISVDKVEIIENQPAQNKDFVQIENQKVQFHELKKFSNNSKKSIEDKKEEIQKTDYVFETKNIETPIVQKLEQQLIANNPVIVPTKKSSTEFVKADELLFGRELQKKREKMANNGKVFGDIDISLVQKIRPSTVKVLGITVFSEEESK